MNKQGCNNEDILKNATGTIVVSAGYSLINIESWHPQHLYFTLFEQIEDGMCYIDKNGQTVIQAIDNYSIYGIKGNVIKASTDPSLGLPAIAESFVKRYVSVNGRIDKVSLELVSEDILTTHRSLGIMTKYLKLTANNEVIVVDSLVQLEQPDCDVKAIQDKELEDAANSGTKSPYGVLKFKAGANWQKERSTKEILGLKQTIFDLEYRLNH